MAWTRWLATVAAITLLTLLCLTIVSRWPRPYQIKIIKPVYETRYTEEVVAITLDPSGGTITVPQQNGTPIQGTIQLNQQVGHFRLGVTDPVMKEVEHTETVQPTAMDNLRFWVLAGAAVLAGLAIAGALLIWLNEYRNGKKPPAKVDKFLYTSLVFMSGLLMGNFGRLPEQHTQSLGEVERGSGMQSVPSVGQTAKNY